MMDLYRLAEMRGESVRRDAEVARLVEAGRPSGRLVVRVRVRLARWLVALATRLWPEAPRNTPGAWPTLGSAR